MAHDLHRVPLEQVRRVPLPADKRIAVQHHARVACAAEFRITEPFLGVAASGNLGMGDDGTLWGGEVLLADLRGYRRVAQFARAPLPGGALAVKRPYRMALGYLFGSEAFEGGEAGLDTARTSWRRRSLERLDPRESR
ncbi:MAG: hypothetical protein U0838_14355 [Chloroflexota bacterium]